MISGLLDIVVWTVAAIYAGATAWLVLMGVNSLALALAVSRRPMQSEHVSIDNWPPAVVQIPVYNEPRNLVARALDAALALDYPGQLEIQLLDDSDGSYRTENAVLCSARPRVHHVMRSSRDGYKAGALASGLEHTNAEMSAIFDVDFRPRPDTLLRLVPALTADPGLAFVQARWTHPGADETALGRAQSTLLDLHFAVEQDGRHRLSLPITFNGTAGVWRRSAIEAAGGWQGDTLAEDLDLALRAQMAGLRARFMPEVTVPADLPDTIDAWRIQQSRWTKGLVEVGRKLLGTVWRSDLPVRSRLSVTAQVAMSGSLPALLTIILLHPGLAAASALEIGPGGAYYAGLGAGWLALVGALVAHLVAQRTLYPIQWKRRLAFVPIGLLAPFALVLTCTAAALAGVVGRRTAFARTPKGSGSRSGGGFRIGDAALAAYSLAGVGVLAAAGAYGALVFQSVFALLLSVVAVAAFPAGKGAGVSTGAARGQIRTVAGCRFIRFVAEASDYRIGSRRESES